MELQLRPSKYRGRTASGVWAYGGMSDDNQCIVQGRDFIRVEPNTLTQSTGKFDKLGRELFDGDVVEFREAGKLIHGVVGWSSSTSSNCVDCQSPVNGVKIYGLCHYNCKRMRKLGNIFDNLFKQRQA